MKKQIIHGYNIESHPKRSTFDEPAHVTIHKLGYNERAYFTPDEAERFAQALIEAAKAARKI